MSDIGLWLTLVLAALGICCIANIMLLRFSMHPSKNREIELLLSGDNAEFLLRSALRAKHGCVQIMAVCEDDEATKICEIFSRAYPNILFKRLTRDT